jgi:error-prone DNA polymerase
MKEVEVKLRRGMEQNGILGATQDKIVQSITSFALYGFPESHAASFALLAYASAYLKCHYLAAFTAAMLNNQPMGFYNAATLVKDAQRHGLKVRPIDMTCSDLLCTLEKDDGWMVMRLGLRYVKGLRKEIAMELLEQRAVRRFASIEDLKLRVPRLQKSELATLASIGALNFISRENGERRGEIHRRDALWQIERASRRAGPLLERTALEDAALETSGSDGARSDSHKELHVCSDTTVSRGISSSRASDSPLQTMTAEERLVADFHGTGMTVGPHPIAYHRAELRKQGIRSANELGTIPDGTWVRIAGSVIARQRPGTAKGFVFLSIEDETGISNAIITPKLFEQDHVVVVHQQFLLIEGPLQNQDNVISVKAARIRPLSITRAKTVSHDFH